MGQLRATIHVDLEPERAFEAFADADALAKWFPGARAIIEPTGPLDQVGTSYTLKFTGPVRAHCNVTAVNKPTLHERTFHRRPLGIRGHARMRFQADNGGTRIELDGDYTLPAGPLGRALDKLVPRAGDRGAQAELTSFKAFLDQANSDEP